MARLAVLIIAAAACGSGDDPDGGAAGTAYELPSPTAVGLPAGVPDTTRHAVPLADVHFDTFGAGPLTLASAEASQIANLVDRIPPITEPRYDDASGGEWLDADDLVIGYVGDEGGAHAYPHKILNFHEIVDDTIDDVPVLVSYCPLCRSGVVYDRRLEDVGDAAADAGSMLGPDAELSFGNTSALYDNDLVMFDRQTNSYWWQVAGEAIVGPLTGARLTPLPSATMTWAAWRELHPDTKVLSRDTGFGRNYAVDPFAGYERRVDAGSTAFPVEEDALADRRLSPGALVIGVEVGDEARAFPVGIEDSVVNTTIADRAVAVVTTLDRAGAAFDRRVDGEDLELRFDPATGEVVHDSSGSRWDLAGAGIDGPLADEALQLLPSRSTFWFAYVAAFPDARVGA